MLAARLITEVRKKPEGPRTSFVILRQDYPFGTSKSATGISIAYEQPEKPLEHKKGEHKKHKTHKNKKFCGNNCVQANLRIRSRCPNRGYPRRE